MADNKQKPTENPQGQPSGVPDVLRLGEIKAPEKAPEIAAEKTEVKKETTKGTAEIKREMLQMEVNPDKDTPAKIERLDANQGLESKEQKEGFDLLQTVTSTTLLAMLFDQGVRKEALDKIESLGGIGGSLIAKLNPAERVALKKLQEIGTKPGSALYKALKDKWNRLVSRSYEIYEGAKKAKDSITGRQNPSGTPGTPEQEPTTLWGKIGKFAGDHPILTAGIVAAGAYGVYKIFKWFGSSKDDKDEDESGKKEGIMDKILGSKWASRIKWGLGISAGIFVLGRLIGNEDVSKWLREKLGINITGNRLSQFLIHLSNGEFVEAFKVLFAGPDEHFDVHRSMAEKISKETGTTIDPDTLKSVGNIKYDDFMSTVAEGKSALAGVLGKIPGLSLLVGSSDAAEQEKALRKYFESHAEEINRFKNPTTTVDQVLVNLEGTIEGKPVLPPEIAAINTAIDKLPESIKPAVQEIQRDMMRILPNESFKEVVTNCKKNKIDTKKLENLYAQLLQAKNEYETAINNARDEKDLPIIAEKAQKMHEINDQVCGEVNNLVNELRYRRGWTEAELLAVTQSWKIVRFLRQPQWRREYGKYIVEKYLKKPLEWGKQAVNAGKGLPSGELIGKEFKPNASLSEIEDELKKTTTELSEARSKQTALDKDVNSADKISVNNQKLNKSKVELLEHDEKILNTRKSIAEFEDKLEKLKAPGANGDAAEIARLERGIEQDKSILRTLTSERLTKQSDFLKWSIGEQRLNFEKEFGATGRDTPLTKGHLEQMDALADSISIHRKQIDQQIASKMKEAEEFAKANNPTKLREMSKEINELQKTKVMIDVGVIEHANKLTTKWNTAWQLNTSMKGGAVGKEVKDVMDQEKNQIQRTWSKILYGQQEGSASKKILSKGNMIMYGVFIGAGSVINFMDQSETKDWSKSIGQAAVDTLPFVSTASDIYSTFSGEEYVTGRKLDAGDRALRAAFGIGGAICDASDLAGVFMTARSAYGAAKEARMVGKSMKLGEALKAGKRETDSIEALREMTATGHWTSKMAMGGALGIMGYELFWKPTANVELSKETIDTLGDKVQNTDFAPPKIDVPMKTA